MRQLVGAVGAVGAVVAGLLRVLFVLDAELAWAVAQLLLNPINPPLAVKLATIAVVPIMRPLETVVMSCLLL